MEKIEVVRKGRKQLGAFYLIGENLAFISYKKTAHIYTNGLSSISEALRSGDAMWGFDQDLIYKAERKGATLLGVWDKTENELHLTQLAKALDPSIYRRAKHAGYQLQRMLPVSEFRRARLKVKLVKS
ncbi:hypothetical protein [Chitinibacter tainanensis]|uniref:hypothetical protein n=1 Tax=Chitinibacter tainanensis TaxID=230667 RepID=UPI0012EC35FC|nr:hypothetical protein [Chitinibacter tainanensis]